MLRDIRVVFGLMRQEPQLAQDLAIVRRYTVKTMLWLLLTELYLVLQVYPVKFFMDEIVKKHPDQTKLLEIVASFLILYFVGTELLRRMDWHRNTVDLGNWRLWWGFGNRCVLRQSTDWHVQHGTGEKTSLVSRNISRIQVLIDEATFNTFPVALRIGYTTILMFVLGWQFGLLALATCILYGLVMIWAERGISPLGQSFLEDMKAAERKGDELSRNWRTIRSLGMEEVFADENEVLLKRIWQDDIPRHRKYLRYLLKGDRVTSVSRAMLYLVIGLLVIHGGAYSFGTIVLAITWMERSYSNFGRFSEFLRKLKDGKRSLQELVQFLQLKPSVGEPINPTWPTTVSGKVEFRNVLFGYQGSKAPAICKLSLMVEPFTTTALVGPSGCGKSTLMSLLMRDYDVLAGSILVDETDLRSLDYQRYRREAVAMVSQSIELFDRSIAENIRLGNAGASDEEVRAAAVAAAAHDFIMEFPDGYDSQVGENGVRLSGGQRQRIAIARALIRHPRILIMDEATSSLDALSQAEVQQTVNRLIESRTCTIFIIAHRLSTVMNADQVVVMESGQISGIGTHAELQKRNGLYAQLCELELEKGILDDETTE